MLFRYFSTAVLLTYQATSRYIVSMMVKPDKKLGKRIKEYRLSREWTQVQASVFFRVSLITIIRVENGRGCSDLIRAKFENKLKVEQQAIQHEAQAVA